MDVNAEERRLTGALALWAAGSIAKGASAMELGRRRNSRYLIDFGRQSVLWGAIDGAIAAVGIARRQERSGEELEAHRQRLQRIVLLNAAMDVAYVAGGVWLLAATRDGRRVARMGTGDAAAIIVQGGFLLVLDSVFVKRLSA